MHLLKMTSANYLYPLLRRYTLDIFDIPRNGGASCNRVLAYWLPLINCVFAEVDFISDSPSDCWTLVAIGVNGTPPAAALDKVTECRWLQFNYCRYGGLFVCQSNYLITLQSVYCRLFTGSEDNLFVNDWPGDCTVGRCRRGFKAENLLPINCWLFLSISLQTFIRIK